MVATSKTLGFMRWSFAGVTSFWRSMEHATWNTGSRTWVTRFAKFGSTLESILKSTSAVDSVTRRKEALRQQCRRIPALLCSRDHSLRASRCQCPSGHLVYLKRFDRAGSADVANTEPDIRSFPTRRQRIILSGANWKVIGAWTHQLRQICGDQWKADQALNAFFATAKTYTKAGATTAGVG